MRLSTGTSGYSYAGWHGTFYPEDLPARQRLAFYAERLSAVEINNTFYRLPRASVVEGWAAQVPGHFRFAIKASRRITHFKRLVDAGEETEYLLRSVSLLGERLGCVLFQLPPNLKADLERLDAFLELLPEGTRAAFEFRHPSWREEEVHERLRARDLALVAVDTGEGEAPELVPTASWGYLRLRAPSYSAEELGGWVQRLRELPWQEVFVFFKHEEAGTGARLAVRLHAAW